ncbi:MAG TPA: two-component regulator propeller domain-containing protein [Vicinamibacterales bacterium]|jgi:signal transduction histidine kinase/ligand-binding sensor domain-containing protein|nr:two-component regulator propeller domain-containing protein [Vicinamibacterales bacterium]
MRFLIPIGLAATVLGWSPAALALNPALDLSQYSHASWRVRDGALKDAISAITQARDGYLWLGTQFGVLRFDGVRYQVWQPPAGQHLPSNYIRSLLGTRDGSLWIGTELGLARWKNATLTLYPELAEQAIGVLLEDREGTVWAGTRQPRPGLLCAFRDDAVTCTGERREFGDRTSSLYEDRHGRLWVGAQTGLWRWKPGPPSLYPLFDIEGSQAIVESGERDTLLIVVRGALKQLSGEHISGSPVAIDRPFLPSHVLRDRDGGLWIGTFDRGLLRVHDGRIDSFSVTDGLSGDYIRTLFEDREGNIWVATDNGLDRFRDIAVATITVKHGLSQTAWSVLAAKDGSVWVGTLDGLNRLQDGRLTIYRTENFARSGSERAVERIRPVLSANWSSVESPRPRWNVREIRATGLPHNLIHSLFEDDRRRIWVSTHAGVAYFENERFIPVGGISGGVQAITGDATGNIWISEDHDLLHVVDDRIVKRISWASLGLESAAVVMLANPVGGGLWLGFRPSGLKYFKDGHIVASFGAPEGVGRGLTGGLHRDADGTIWVATEGGISRVKDGRVHTLTVKNGLPCDGVNWVIEDDDRALWLYTACGLARVGRRELDTWAAAVAKDPATLQRVHAAVLHVVDGVRIHAAPGGYTPQVTRSPDGRIWFLPWDGVSVLDPRRLPFNALPPPVRVEQITADGQTYEGGSRGRRLPPRVRDLSIDYTALSFVVPEKVRFRYRLEGQDPDWREVVNERTVKYSNLGPGDYRFRVVAANNNGVWNEAGDVLEFSIAPAYYQTNTFRALCVTLFTGLLWTAWRLRLRQLERRFELNMGVRVAERTRIARELHDTLLQSFHGLLLRFQTVWYLLPDCPAEAKEKLERAIAQAAQAITEGRDAVQALRTSTVETDNLPVAISTLGQELATDSTSGQTVAFHVAVEGEARDLRPTVRDEIYKTAAEALRNAFRHARARRIEVDIRYDYDEFRLRVRDDGKGIDPAVLAGQGIDGHYGLRGMPERAALIGGKLAVWSEVGTGTEVELRLPASIVYARRWRLSRSWPPRQVPEGHDGE